MTIVTRQKSLSEAPLDSTTQQYNLFKLLPQYSDQEIVKPTGREHCPFYSYLMRVLASAADSSVMQTRFLFQKYATSKPVAASYPPHVDRRLRPLHIMLRSSVHSGRRHVAGPQYSSCSTSTKLDTGANSSRLSAGTF